jgi:Bacterial Ig-like domain (group 2)
MSPGSRITRIEIGGPPSVAPGDVVQLTATAHLADGSSRDVTTEVRWNSSNRTVLSMSPDGRATGHAQGEAMVTAFSNVTSTREVIVVPRGTYRVVGLVTEAEGPSEPVIGATVAVTAGLGAGFVTTTGGDGRYRLYGVAGDVELRITKDGYLNGSIAVLSGSLRQFPRGCCGVQLGRSSIHVATVEALTRSILSI